MNETTLILKELKDRVRAEAEDISDVLDLIDEEIQMAETWEQIDKMSPEEVHSHLLAHGYTEKELKEFDERIRAIVARVGGESKERAT